MEWTEEFSICFKDVSCLSERIKFNTLEVSFYSNFLPCILICSILHASIYNHSPRFLFIQLFLHHIQYIRYIPSSGLSPTFFFFFLGPKIPHLSSSTPKLCLSIFFSLFQLIIPIIHKFHPSCQ